MIAGLSTSSFSPLSWVNFSLNFYPNLRGAFCLRFSRKMAVFALFCVGQSGADAQLGSSAIARETRFTNTSQPHIPFMQCAGGLQDGATRCAQLLNMLHDLPTEDQDADDPVTFINTDIKAAFQEMCRQTSFDMLTGKATKPYDDGQVHPGDDIPTMKELSPFLGYFKAMHSTACTNRYPDHRGHTHHVKGTTGGQQGGGLEMRRFSLSQHPIWSRVLAPHRRARGVGLADDSYIYAALKAAFKVLVEIRQRLGQDAKLRFNMTKVKFYIPGVSRK
jgi:hypothetical protein